MAGLRANNSQITGKLSPQSQQIQGQVSSKSQQLRGNVMPGMALVSDYEILRNKPRINSVELVGDKSFPELGIRPISSGEILDILNI